MHKLNVKNVYINKYNNSYYRTNKRTSVGFKDNTCFNFGKEVNDKDLNFKIGDHVRTSKHKKTFF